MTTSAPLPAPGTYQTQPANADDIEKGDIEREWSPFPIQPFPEDWTLEKIRAARKRHDIGIFSETVRLRDVLTVDPRVESGLMQRCATPIGLTVDVTPAKARGGKGVSANVAAEVKSWFKRGSKVAGHAVRRKILEDLVMGGVAIAQLHWRFEPDEALWYVDRIEPWPLEFTWYNPALTALQIITTDGLYTPRHGDGKWIVIEPYGTKSWLHGAVRALSMPWADRAFGVRYRAAAAARQGGTAPIGELPEGIPINSDDGKQFQRLVKALWQGRPWGVKPFGSKLELLEAKTNAWQIFNDIVKTSDADIAIALLGQDATQAKGSVYTSPQFKGVRFDYAQNDAQALDGAFETGAALPYVAVNYGTEFCPSIESAVPDPEEADRRAAVARNYEAFGRGVVSLRSAGAKVTAEDWERMGDEYGITPPKLEKDLEPFPEPKLPPANDPAKAKDTAESTALRPTPDEKEDAA